MLIKNNLTVREIQEYNSDVSDEILSDLIVIKSGTSYTLPSDTPDGVIVIIINDTLGSVSVNSISISSLSHIEAIKLSSGWRIYS